MSNSFVAIDFETANNARASVCEVGLYRIIDGQPDGQFCSLVLPPPDIRDFDPRFVRIHGINDQDVQNAPNWGDLWSEINQFIDGLPLVAHNASFDISVLRAVLSEFAYSWPELDYWCTLVLSRSNLNLPTYSLSSVSYHLDVPHENNHRAGDDAKTAALVMQNLLERTATQGLQDVQNVGDVRIGHLFSDGWRPCRSSSNTFADSEIKKKERIRGLGIDQNSLDPSGDFYDKNVIITGALASMTRSEAEQLLTASGANIKSGVSAKVDYLISGEQDPRKMAEGETQSSKFRKVVELREQGSKIEIIDEEQFLQMLKD